jgi:hypothetical protein
LSATHHRILMASPRNALLGKMPEQSSERGGRRAAFTKQRGETSSSSGAEMMEQTWRADRTPLVLSVLRTVSSGAALGERTRAGGEEGPPRARPPHCRPHTRVGSSLEAA